jgi:phosphoglycolate phosphatase
MTKYKYAIFDLDGTLFDTITDIMNSGNELLETYDKPPFGLTDFKQFVGLGVKKMIGELIQKGGIRESDIDTLTEKYLGIYRRRMLEETTLYPGIQDLLVALKDEGIKLAVLSNKPQEDVDHLLEEFRMNDQFAFVMGKKPEYPIKPDPSSLKAVMSAMQASQTEVVFIGDTKTDIETAKNAKVTSIGVTWGFRPYQELETAGADHIVDKPDQILQIVKG